jgi:hypothetical protein
MAGYMGTKLLAGIASSIAFAILLGTGIHIYSQGSCGYYPILELDCSELLSETETQKLLQNRQSDFKEIMQINPKTINISVQPESRCPGKSVIVISHSSEKNCDAMNEIIRRDFSDIPYKIVNN